MKPEDELDPEASQDQKNEFDFYSLVFGLLAFLAVFGWWFNVGQVAESALYRVYLIDLIVYSYTNLLAVPVLLFATFARKKETRRFSRDDIQLVWGFFIGSPFIWFIGELASDFLFLVVENW